MNLRTSWLAALALAIPMFTVQAEEQKAVSSPLEFQVQSLEGEAVNLADYRGKVVLIVNVASKCGATPQYAGLEALYEAHKDDGLVVLGFPCNQFGRQEPGTAAQIREFCSATYGVKFPLMAKVDVNGEQASPVYQFLTSKETNPKFAGPIRWNFEKFLVDRSGKVVARFGTGVEPDSAEMKKAIAAALEAK
jgi:glutathione peroxidase